MLRNIRQLSGLGVKELFPLAADSRPLSSMPKIGLGKNRRRLIFVKDTHLGTGIIAKNWKPVLGFITNKIDLCCGFNILQLFIL